MSFTNGDDPCLDAEIEGRRARRQGRVALSNPYDEVTPMLRNSWIAGWMDEDKILRTGKENRS